MSICRSWSWALSDKTYMTMGMTTNGTAITMGKQLVTGIMIGYLQQDQKSR